MGTSVYVVVRVAGNAECYDVCKSALPESMAATLVLQAPRDGDQEQYFNFELADGESCEETWIMASSALSAAQPAVQQMLDMGANVNVDIGMMVDLEVPMHGFILPLDFVASASRAAVTLGITVYISHEGVM